MLDVYRIAENLANINATQLLKKILGRNDIQALMIKLNTENQLEKLNENPFGIKLYKIGGKYAPSTSKRKGVGATKIDLKDSGNYYRTFKVVPLANGSANIISDNTIHGSDTFLSNERWGVVEGLNEKNTLIVLRAIDEEIINWVLR
jgi:hypothetical protein